MRNKAFTYIEMMIVAAIVGIVAAIIAPAFVSKTNRIITCYSGEKIIYEGPGHAFTGENGCTVFGIAHDQYHCTACSERKL